MPVKSMKETHRTDGRRPEASKSTIQKFTSIDEIRAALRTQNSEVLVQNLTALRNQLSIKPSEHAVSPQDERLLLAQHWLESMPGAYDVFEMWDGAAQRQNSILTLLVSLLSSLLTLLSSHYTFQALGQPILKTLLTPTYTRRLNSYLGGSHNELILVTLKLFNAVSTFAGGKEKKAVLEAFGWEIKSLPKLLNMRRRDDTADPLSKPDIRTLYILFLLSFTDADSSAQIKITFLEQHRDPFLAIFKGLIQDPYPVVRRIFESCWSDIWSDPKVKRTLKIGLFNEFTISHMIKLYERTIPEDSQGDHITADLVHHFLLAICTCPGTGICFRDRGWYPRETEEGRGGFHQPDNEEEEGDGRQNKKGRIHNKILANIVKTLKVNEDLRQQELALKILTACPELVSGYWSGAALTLEPRLSSKWIANIAFFGSVISIPVPQACFFLTSSDTSTDRTKLYNPSPPPLSNILENILPSVNTKSHLSKGLQSPSALVQHCSAIALAKCLMKYEKVGEAFQHVEDAIGEDGEGTWAKRRRDMEREVRRRVPDFQVVVAFSQQHRGEDVVSGTAAVPPSSSAGPAAGTTPNWTRAALLAESAQRLLWLYQRCLPAVVAEARFDVGKLLHGFSVEVRKAAGDEEGEGEEGGEAARRLSVVRQLHVLRLLKDNHQFVWTGKIGSSSHSYFAVLLKAYASPSSPTAIRTAISSLLQHVMSQSILFQEDASEPHLWLLALPASRRARGTEAPDGASLTNEAEGVVTFLDDCVQRCLKTPYRYMEEMDVLVGGSSRQGQEGGNDDDGTVTPAVTATATTTLSPLLMTVLEQLEIKASKRLLSPSDILALATFVRKLGFRLAHKGTDDGLGVMKRVWKRVDEVVLPRGKLFDEEFPVMADAVRREVRMFGWCVGVAGGVEPSLSPAEDMNVEGEVPLVLQAVMAFLDAVEGMSLPEKEEKRATTANELIDWVRLLNENLGVNELRRVAAILENLWKPSIADLIQNVDPASGCLWEGLDIVRRFDVLRPYLQFDLLFLHSTAEQLLDQRCRDILSEVVVGHGESSMSELKRAIVMISHKVTASADQDEVVNGLFLLLASILRLASGTLGGVDHATLKELVFVQSPALELYFTSERLSDVILQGLQHLVTVSLDSTDSDDQALVSDISTYWFNALRGSFPDVYFQVPLVAIWIRFFQSKQVFNLLDILVADMEMFTSTALDLLQELLSAVHRWTVSDVDTELELKRRLPQLFALHRVLPRSDVLEELIAIGVEASLLICCSGTPLRRGDGDDLSLASLVRRAETRWSRRSTPSSSSDLPVESFLMQDTWSASTVRIVSALIYQGALSRDRVVAWLKTDDATGRAVEHYVPVLFAFFDVCLADGAEMPLEEGLCSRHFSRLLGVVCDERQSRDIRSSAGVCVSALMKLVPSGACRFIEECVGAVRGLSVTALHHDLLLIARRLPEGYVTEARGFRTMLVNHGVQWATRVFGGGEGEDRDLTVEALTSLIPSASGVNPHHVETLASVVIQTRLFHGRALKLVTTLLSTVPLKPVIVNRLLQGIIQHPLFFKLCTGSGSGPSPTRDAIVHLLHVMFHLHPTNTCQATHVEPLVRIYRGTLSKADRRLLTIFQLFEVERKASIASLLGRWSAEEEVEVVCTGPLEALRGLDAVLVLRTCLGFPRWRKLEEVEVEKGVVTEREAQLYDPVFLMLLFAQTLAEDPPGSAFEWVEVFRTNVVSLVIKGLSSRDEGIRDVALTQLAVLWRSLETADLHEKPHVLHILSLLKNVFPPPLPGEAPRRLPSYTTLLLAHALRGIFYPSNFIYPLTARFLLQRPELDTKDVPMLYGMLYSGSDEWKKERGWMVRFLADGMMSSEDWRVLKGRHTWDLLASVFQSSEEDRQLRAGVLEVLANLTCNVQATSSLVLKYGLVAWIEMQLGTASTVVEGVEWVKVLGNIVSVVDPEKVEMATGGAWRAAVCRCLTMLLDDTRTCNTAAVFPFAVPVALRLSLLLPGSAAVPGFDVLLAHAMACLVRMEGMLDIPPTSTDLVPIGDGSVLYGAHEVHELFLPAEDPVRVWGWCVESLWRAVMSQGEKKSEVWDRLSSRLLVWRGLCDGSVVGEWARMQAVCYLHGQGRV